MNEIDSLKRELEFWKEISNLGYLIRKKDENRWYIEKNGVILPFSYPTQDEAAEMIRKLNNKQVYRATMLYNEGYGKQCKEIGPFEAESNEEAQKIAKISAEKIFGDNPKVEILEIKVKMVKNSLASQL